MRFSQILWKKRGESFSKSNREEYGLYKSI